MDMFMLTVLLIDVYVGYFICNREKNKGIWTY